MTPQQRGMPPGKDTMHARNPRNGTPIVASLERVYGRTSLVRDGFSQDADGLVERQIEGPTEMLWNTSESIGYLDANDEQVYWEDIEVYEPETTPEAAGDARAPAAGRAASGAPMHDPAARAGNTAARAVERILAEVDNYHDEEAAAAASDGDDDETTTDEVLEAFTSNACAGVAGLDVTSRLDNPSTLGNRPSLTKHADEAVIRLKGPRAVRIHCFRAKNGFQVKEVTATEDEHLSRMKPDTASATQLNLYAETILHAWGL